MSKRGKIILTDKQREEMVDKVVDLDFELMRLRMDEEWTTEDVVDWIKDMLKNGFKGYKNYTDSKLIEEYEITSMQDEFHLGCSNFPNCDMFGCGYDD